MNDKIGKWSLYGTIGGFLVLGTLYTIFNEGIKSFIIDMSPLIIGLVAFFLIIYIISLFPAKWIPIMSVFAFLAFTYYMHQSWKFTTSITVLCALYYLVNKNVKNKRVSKCAYIILLIGLLITLTY